MDLLCVLLMTGLLLSPWCCADQKFYVTLGDDITFTSYATKGAGHGTWSFKRPGSQATTFFSSALYPTYYSGRNDRLRVRNLNLTSDVCVEYELHIHSTVYTDAGSYRWNTSSMTCALAAARDLQVVLAVAVKEPSVTCFLPVGRSGYCTASTRIGIPVPRITWHSRDAALTVSRNVTDISQSGYVASRVSWPHVTYLGFHGKVIECSVVQTTESGEDIFPMISKFLPLQVSDCPAGPPITTPVGGPLTLDYGDTLKLSCESMNGFPLPTLAWFRNETQLSSLQVQRLIFNVTVVADANYRCTSVSELTHCSRLESVISVSIRRNGSAHDPTYRPPNDVTPSVGTTSVGPISVDVISLGAVLGTVIVILLVILIVYCIWSRRRLNAAGHMLPPTTSPSSTNNINATCMKPPRPPLPNPALEMEANCTYTQYTDLHEAPSGYDSTCFSNNTEPRTSTYLHSVADVIGDDL